MSKHKKDKQPEPQVSKEIHPAPPGSTPQAEDPSTVNLKVVKDEPNEALHIKGDLTTRQGSQY